MVVVSFTPMMQRCVSQRSVFGEERVMSSNVLWGAMCVVGEEGRE